MLLKIHLKHYFMFLCYHSSLDCRTDSIRLPLYCLWRCSTASEILIVFHCTKEIPKDEDELQRRIRAFNVRTTLARVWLMDWFLNFARHSPRPTILDLGNFNQLPFQCQRHHAANMHFYGTSEDRRLIAFELITFRALVGRWSLQFGTRDEFLDTQMIAERSCYLCNKNST
jgi:hypothetical protein